MSGEGGTVDDRTVDEIIEGLRALLGAIEDGRVEATDAQRACLPGLMDAVESTAQRPH